jgi:hypothetical protein
MRLSSPFSTFKYSQQPIPDSLKSVAMALEAEMFTNAEPHCPRGENPKSGRPDDLTHTLETSQPPL